MRGYPSEQSIPPVAQERAVVAVGIVLAFSTIAAYVWLTLWHELRWTDLLVFLAVGLLHIAAFGLFALWLRRRRLIRVREREALLKSLAQLTLDEETID